MIGRQLALRGFLVVFCIRCDIPGNEQWNQNSVATVLSPVTCGWRYRWKSWDATSCEATAWPNFYSLFVPHLLPWTRMPWIFTFTVGQSRGKSLCSSFNPNDHQVSHSSEHKAVHQAWLTNSNCVNEFQTLSLITREETFWCNVEESRLIALLSATNVPICHLLQRLSSVITHVVIGARLKPGHRV